MAQTVDPPRRMSREKRRRQLIASALSEIAESGSRSLSLDDVAERAGVTRNLIYHYFPRGRRDLELAAVEEAAVQLTDSFETDPSVALEEKLRHNLGGFVTHAWGRTDAWRAMIELRSRVDDEEIRARADGYRDQVAAAISLNHFGTASPGPLAHAAICGFIEFATEALNQGREHGLEAEDVVAMLGEVLYATAAAARPHLAG